MDGDRTLNDPVGPLYLSPHWYDIFKEEGLATRAEACGLCGPDTQTIYIDAQLGETVEKETLLHEAMHGLWSQTELDKKYTDKDEERVIFTLAPRILALLRENPEFTEWLTEGKLTMEHTETKEEQDVQPATV